MIRDFLPYKIYKLLFGDRKRFGKVSVGDDVDWKKWQSLYKEVYVKTQRSNSISNIINNSGYSILNKINLEELLVAEIGPGGGYHFSKFNGVPRHYSAIDVCDEFFDDLKVKASKLNMPFTPIKVMPNDATIPIESNSQDILLTFYSLEHLYPLDKWIDEIFRIIKPGGFIVGAIPSEGGVAWGIGRLINSTRVVKRLYDLDLEKIVCWEHPNFCDEILSVLKNNGPLVYSQKWPFNFLPIDMSLLIKFIVKK